MSDAQFLTIASIPGEVVDDQHPGAIEVVNWSWAVSNLSPGDQGARGGVAQAQLSDLALLLRMDMATPHLFDACARGIHVAEAVLSVRREGMVGDYLSLRLKDAVVTSVNTALSGDDPFVQITLSFVSVTMTYQSPLPDGSLGDPVSVALGR
jgi:type VI secretion system secreted protein Hcp